ncbi:hypothetical protein [Micromonospora sp. b486]|uniref:hypothetical protein n=1 Tax=Micromonospora sp. b486 TaxID=3053986 RepID=UPI00259CD204|nr:hypothetical protein [Micromonospora sp. b486]MDM4784514.1 hypothetical protein [Micromonospora sp. b486]
MVEAMPRGGADRTPDAGRLAAALAEQWRVPSRTALLTADAPEFAVPVRTG